MWCYNPEDRHNRSQTWSEESPEGRFRKFSYDDIVARDKTNLDIFWLKNKNLVDLVTLPDPTVLANEIIENIETLLDSFREVMDIGNGNASNDKAYCKDSSSNTK